MGKLEAAAKSKIASYRTEKGKEKENLIAAAAQKVREECRTKLKALEAEIKDEAKTRMDDRLKRKAERRKKREMRREEEEEEAKKKREKKRKERAAARAK